MEHDSVPTFGLRIGANDILPVEVRIKRHMNIADAERLGKALNAKSALFKKI